MSPGYGHDQGAMVATGDLLAPWRAHAPTTLVLGLQKSGTTLAGAALAAAMNSPYEPEAAAACCDKLGIEDCARNTDEVAQTYNFLPHGHFFSKDMRSFFEKCADYTLLGQPWKVPRPQGGTEMKRFPIGMLKADLMLPDAPAFANFARAEKLNFQLVYVTRHPLTVIRSTQAWAASKNARGKHLKWGTSVPELAKMWRRAAKVATEVPFCETTAMFPGTLSTPGPPTGPRCIFAAVVRYEDLIADPYESTVALYTKLFPRSGGHFPGRPAPPREAAFPAGWHERVQKAVDNPENHPDDFVRHKFVNESFTDEELIAVGNDGGHELMQGFNYTMADVYAKPLAVAFVKP